MYIFLELNQWEVLVAKHIMSECSVLFETFIESIFTKIIRYNSREKNITQVILVNLMFSGTDTNIQIVIKNKAIGTLSTNSSVVAALNEIVWVVIVQSEQSSVRLPFTQ